MDEKNKEIADMETAHAAEKKEFEDTLGYRDVEMFRLEAALRNVSAEVVARDAKLLALSTYSKAQNQTTTALEAENTELKTKLVHCEEALSKAATSATEVVSSRTIPHAEMCPTWWPFDFLFLKESEKKKKSRFFPARSCKNNKCRPSLSASDAINSF